MVVAKLRVPLSATPPPRMAKLVDIEDLGTEQCSHYTPPPPKGTPAARLHALSGHVNQRRQLGTPSENCYTCTAQCATSEAAAPADRQALMKTLMDIPEVQAELAKPGTLAAVREIMAADDPRKAAMAHMGNSSVMAVVSKAQAAMAKAEGGAPEEPVAAEQAASYPLTNPFGDGISLEELMTAVQTITKQGRGTDLTKDTLEEQQASFNAQMAQFRKHKASAQEQAEKTGDWPQPRTLGSNPNPNLNHAGVEAIHSANLEEMVEHNKNGTVPAPWPPHVIDAHETYADTARWERECEHFKTSAVIAGISTDLPEAHSYKRFEVLGKSVLLTRDGDGVFRAFENRCMHRGAELVNKGDFEQGKKMVHVCDFHAWSYGSNGKLLGVPEEYGFDAPDDGSGSAAERGGLTELHCAERAGLLLVIATPCSEEEALQKLDAAMPPELEGEVSQYRIGNHYRMIEQSFGIESNWKLPIDTFGETYHFSS